MVLVELFHMLEYTQYNNLKALLLLKSNLLSMEQI